jgi:hypothetical protein
VPCLVALFALISPRLAIFLLWLFTDRMTLAFTSGWLGIFGFLFLPWTTLAWTVCYAPIFGVSGFGYIVVLFGFVLDISSYASSKNLNRN